MSNSLEEFEYPYPTEYMNFSVYGEVFLIPDVGHNPHEEVADVVSGQLIRFLDSRN